MKYRIKITTFKNGRQLFMPELKKLFIWYTINYEGYLGYTSHSVSRQEALDRIDKHNNGNATIKSIEFEYINND